jgi:uncharacterized protein (DUF342 family)
MADGTTIEVFLESDKRVARIEITPVDDFDEIQLDHVEEIVRKRGVVINDDVLARLSAIVSSFNEQPARISEVIARAIEPTHGMDASLDWEAGFAPEEAAVDASESPAQDADAAPDAEPAAADETVDFYNVSHFSTIEPGTHIATVIEPTGGTPGRDVTGEQIPARPGRPLQIKIGEGLILTDEQKVVANQTGVMQFNGRSLSVTRLLEVPDYVDFSTGNINFDGAVVVRHGVRDNFVVKAGEDLIVYGLVEAASIICSGSVTLRRGMSGHPELDRGQVLIDGDLHTRYLMNVRGRIRGDVRFRRELMDCNLIVGGELHGEQGSIVGGSVDVTGQARVAVIGTPGNARTVITLGNVGMVSAQLGRLRNMKAEHERTVQRAQNELNKLGTDRSLMQPSERERMMDFTFSMNEAKRSLHFIQKKEAELIDAIKGQQKLDLWVLRAIYPGVQINAGTHEVTFSSEIKGPIHIFWDHMHRLRYRLGNSEARPLGDIARDMNMAA